MCIMMIILLQQYWYCYGKIPDKKRAKLFAEKVEDALDAIVTGKDGTWKKNWRIASGEEQEHN